ncbi:MAG TPA: ribosome small subunit-dependent GTPase A [Lachnospiraceae bacterium]|nr:ribosome small subunit-dependent GTPase A [Lachnospiraceae bacterium]
MTGIIIKGIAGFYYVYVAGSGIYECKARGIFRKDKQKPLVGDRVRIEVLDEKDWEGNLVEILPRKNELIRPAVANVDQAMVIFAADYPKPNFSLLDRFLIMMERQQVSTVICFNKTDLLKAEEAGTLHRHYELAGYTVLMTSVQENRGVEAVRDILWGRTTVVAGPSGVGKSSLTNAVQQEVHMETGDISRKLNRGKHTTRHSQMIMLGQDTWLVDTPGFSSLYVPDMEKEELREYFPEFRVYQGRCRFQGCTHTHEPGCAVKDALDGGLINRQRYEGYLELYRELKDRRKY